MSLMEVLNESVGFSLSHDDLLEFSDFTISLLDILDPVRSCLNLFVLMLYHLLDLLLKHLNRHCLNLFTVKERIDRRELDFLHHILKDIIPVHIFSLMVKIQFFFSKIEVSNIVKNRIAI